jgi:hypothetical protein
MAVTNTHPKNFVLGLYKGTHNFTASTGNTFKVLLMNTTYAFSASVHTTIGHASVVNSILASTTNTLTVGVALSASASSCTLVTAANTSWTSALSALPATGAALIYNDTAASDPIVACIDFGADYTTPAGATFQINFTNGLFKGTPV